MNRCVRLVIQVGDSPPTVHIVPRASAGVRQSSCPPAALAANVKDRCLPVRIPRRVRSGSQYRPAAAGDDPRCGAAERVRRRRLAGGAHLLSHGRLAAVSDPELVVATAWPVDRTTATAPVVDALLGACAGRRGALRDVSASSPAPGKNLVPARDSNSYARTIPPGRLMINVRRST